MSTHFVQALASAQQVPGLAEFLVPAPTSLYVRKECEDGDRDDLFGGDDVPSIERDDPGGEEIEFADAVGTAVGAVRADGVAALVFRVGALDLDPPDPARNPDALAATTDRLGRRHLNDEVVRGHAPDRFGNDEAAFETLPEKGTLRLVPKKFGVAGAWHVSCSGLASDCI